jgi:hypothetical protein
MLIHIDIVHFNFWIVLFKEITYLFITLVLEMK